MKSINLLWKKPDGNLMITLLASSTMVTVAATTAIMISVAAITVSVEATMITITKLQLLLALQLLLELQLITTTMIPRRFQQKKSPPLLTKKNQIHRNRNRI